MSAIASLPMYDWPELKSHTDRWWQVLDRAFEEAGLDRVPTTLTRHTDPHQDWQHPELFLSQTCGYPLWFEHRDALQVVAVPCYQVEGCEGAYYSSMIVTRKENAHLSLVDFGEHRAAYNAENSQSG